jgi:LacI family transcriptional regulator
VVRLVKHPFRIREIAAQAGLSEATVDRVLHGRGSVRESAAREVHDAIADLERQRRQVRLAGRTFMIDVVMQAPARFSGAVRDALEVELPFLQPATIRSRFFFRESAEPSELVRQLDRISRRGSHGVIIKAPDVPDVTEAVARLEARAIPVVTLVTDLPQSARRAYVGIDNRAAGQTAAYLVDQWLGPDEAHVLVTLSSSSFRGEEEREAGFRSAIRRVSRDRHLVEITETDGLDEAMRDVVSAALERDSDIAAVYSIGGGNIATLAAFAALDRPCRVFVAHDLDEDNRSLLRRGRLSAVLHHDLNQDMRHACQAIMSAHDAIPGDALVAGPSPIQVVTPYNVPPVAALSPTRATRLRA